MIRFSGIIALDIFILTLSISTSDSKVLDDYIRHYEELHYDKEFIHQTHMRHKRSVDHVLHLPLEAFGRKLHLELKKDRGVFTDGYQTELSNGTLVDVDLSFLYSGKVKGVPNSHCYGSVIQGVFQGTIHLPGEIYHIEKSKRFFNDAPVFHSVIYRESDMNLDPFKERRERERREANDVGSCGNDRVREWMRDVGRSEVVKPNRAVRSALEWQEIHSGNYNKYAAYANEPQKRQKREESKIVNLAKENMNTCTLFLRSDPIFWKRYKEKAGGNPEVARDEIIAFFNSHVQMANRIYGGTTFETYDGGKGYKGIQFAVQRTKIMEDADCTGSTQVSRFCQSNIDVSNFLNLNSLENHNLYCLAYIFTYRDFTAGTLGLAWVGASDSSSGGICEVYKEFKETEDKRVWKSLNTGIVTTINYAKEVPFKVSQLTFAHEMGHNFGSPHDTGAKCAPYGTTRSDASEGNYLMFASATMGDKPHNNHFSECSRDNITRVLHAVIDELNGKKRCLQSTGPFCGNGLVEEGEECDCGFENDCEDNCCNPKMENNQGDPTVECTLKGSAVCSPSQGPCCTSTCQYVTGSSSKVCRYEQDCTDQSVCNGTTAKCPDPVKRKDGTYCNNFGFTCKDGECAGSLCERFGWTECFLTGSADTVEEQRKLCNLACQKNDTSGSTECIQSDAIEDIPEYAGYRQMVREVKGNNSAQTGVGITLASGSPCNNYQGYCDVFHKCKVMDADGPLSRLKKLLFDPETLKTIKDWIVEHWWAVLLMAVGLVIAMGLFIKFCAVHTPSSNPKAKPARKLTDTLRRRRNPRQGQSQPQQVRYPQYQYDRRDYCYDPRNQYDSRAYDSRDFDYHWYDDRDYDYDPRQQQQELLPDPKYPVKNPQGPPPPYPGSSHPSSSAGPPHGHGKKGRKHRDMEMGRV